MSKSQWIFGGVVLAIWAITYLAAVFYDRSLEPLAKSITPLMMLAFGFLFGKHAIELWRGKRDDS